MFFYVRRRVRTAESPDSGSFAASDHSTFEHRLDSSTVSAVSRSPKTKENYTPSKAVLLLHREVLIAMEVIDCRSALLSNYEVLEKLQEVRNTEEGGGTKKKVGKLRTNLANITYDVEKSLQGTSCSSQNSDVIRNFLAATKNLKITKFEKLQILNLRPTTIVKLQLVLEEVEERFSEEEMQQMIDLFQQLLPPPSQCKQDEH
ncbi:RNA polymerase II Rpb4 [Trinorchestia longiramus]|nr:RNA polymerase II Rpb4 [Trinorchestia longiramus]